MSCDCEFFNFGDPVRNRQNPHLTGVVIGDRNWGSEYQVRLADGASTIWWHGFEIEHDPDGEPPAKEDDDTNVVRRLRLLRHSLMLIRLASTVSVWLSCRSFSPSIRQPRSF